tara:strand:+ start:712 stop:1218 length:507 start_codon:yes stop_codon:yes gene_type:complete
MYAKIVDSSISKYPYTHRDLKKDNPRTSFFKNALEDNLVRDEYGIVEVATTPEPVKPGWITSEVSPTFDGSSWKQTWESVAKDISELHPGEIESVEAPVQEGYIARPTDPVLDGDVWKESWELIENTWLENRIIAYGSMEEQIEFITENGLDAWQSKVAAIKAKYPKS